MTEPVRGGAAAARQSHKLEAGGSNPSRATILPSLPSRLHEKDLAGHWLEKSSDVWEFLRLPE
jgi:hypothetical protein